MFFNRKPPEVELTNEVYAQWLRAKSPPGHWFRRQPPMSQETLAVEGDDYLRHCLAMGQEAANAETEEQALQRLGMIAGGRQGGQVDPAPAVPLTMGGLGKRREEREEARQEAKDSTRRLMGRAPDANRTLTGRHPDDSRTVAAPDPDKATSEGAA